MGVGCGMSGTNGELVHGWLCLKRGWCMGGGPVCGRHMGGVLAVFLKPGSGYVERKGRAVMVWGKAAQGDPKMCGLKRVGTWSSVVGVEGSNEWPSVHDQTAAHSWAQLKPKLSLHGMQVFFLRYPGTKVIHGRKFVLKRFQPITNMNSLHKTSYGLFLPFKKTMSNELNKINQMAFSLPERHGKPLSSFFFSPLPALLSFST